MNDLRLSIRQTFAAIGIESKPAQQRIVSPRGDLQIEQPPARMDFASEPGKLQIDSTQAQHALLKGPNLEWSSYIYGQMKQVFLQLLAEKVQEGNRMAQITVPTSAFAEIARNKVFKKNPVQYQPAVPSNDNVRLSYEPGKVSTSIEPSRPEISYTPRKPQIEVDRGRLDIYLRRRNSIDIQVSTYDLYR